ncbi:hypothetical protein SeMB42_g04920 [Synchytrium endobioticum]|uniref:Uncharacterized protein n=1 Tax=Synchytrium endobioticum TaxID=286115 RepID=A0A507CUV7_9FUNG|nr:hypothetical protein SeMB42_g04920 [Synchytrium endobioticum]
MGDAVRAEYLLKAFQVTHLHVECRELAAQCLIKQEKYEDAKVLMEQALSNATPLPHTDTKTSDPDISIKAREQFLLGTALLKLRKIGRAQKCFTEALLADSRCYDALHSLLEHCSLRDIDGSDILQDIKYTDLAPEVADFVKMMYDIKSRNKYSHDPVFDKKIDEFALQYHLTDNADILISKAEILLVRCRFEECLRIATSILLKDPFNLEILPTRIACLYQLGMNMELFELGHELVDHYPKLAVTWYSVGTYYLAIKKYEDARQYFSKSSLLDSNFGPAWIGFAHTFALSGESVRAINAYSTAVRLFERMHHPRMYIGMEHLYMKDLSLAEEYLISARSICEFDPLLENELGVLYYEKQEYETAAEYFENAIAITGELHEKSLMWEHTYANLGHCYRNLKQYDKAKTCYNKVLQMNPASANAMSVLGMIHHLEGKVSDAIVYYHNALATQPSDILTTELLDRALQDSAAAYQKQELTSNDKDTYTCMLQALPDIQVDQGPRQKTPGRMSNGTTRQTWLLTQASPIANSAGCSDVIGAGPSSSSGIFFGASSTNSGLAVPFPGWGPPPAPTPGRVDGDEDDDGMEVDDE